MACLKMQIRFAAKNTHAANRTRTHSLNLFRTNMQNIQYKFYCGQFNSFIHSRERVRGSHTVKEFLDLKASFSSFKCMFLYKIKIPIMDKRTVIYIFFMSKFLYTSSFLEYFWERPLVLPKSNFVDSNTLCIFFRYEVIF